MKHPGKGSGTADFGKPLVVHLPATLGDVLREHAMLLAADPVALAQRLLMRGLHQHRIDEVIGELFPDDSRQAATDEAGITAMLEASALLVALSDAEPACGHAASASAEARDALERARRLD
jgi:hypothetical protein